MRIGQASVSGMARGILSRLDRAGEGRARADVIGLWRTVAGPEVYSHARGFALRDGELVVFVDSHAWANDLTVMSEHYLAALQSGSGQDTVTSLRFAVSRKVAENKAIEAEERVAGDAPLIARAEASETERQQLRLMAAGIHDEELREAVIAAATAQLEWRKGIEAKNAAERAVQRARGTNPPAQR